MGALLTYWKICKISLDLEKSGYEYRLLPIAQEFVKQTVTHVQGDMQAELLAYFHGDSGAEPITQAKAGLCLRCEVSYPILKACQKIDNLFGGEKAFTYRELLQFVLNDDGKKLVILDRDRKAQLILDDGGEIHSSAYKYFTVEVLRTFKQNASSMSLDNWAYLQTKQNPELKSFLGEFGFKHLSDWAMMNRVRPKQLEQLSKRDRSLLEVFHAVYRRDRQLLRAKGARKCPDPSPSQLTEMHSMLQLRGIVFNSTTALMGELKQVATQLRQYDIWSYREPLEIQDPETGGYTPRPDLPHDSLDELDVEQQEFLDSLQQQLQLAVSEGIELEIQNCINQLKKSKKYAPLAGQFIPGLRLYYVEGLSLKDIAPRLGMSSWDQARRILNPGELLRLVRSRVVQKLLDISLEKAQNLGLSSTPPEPDYLTMVLEQIEAFADREVFQEASDELRAGKNRAMNSVYAAQLRLSLNNFIQA